MCSNPKYPLLLSSIPKAALWGGERLQALFGKDGPDPLAETWELSVREQEKSVILNGPAAGRTLEDYLGVAPQSFPLLVKLIGAAHRLSVQVHPDDAYAAAAGSYGKTEMWYVLEAADGAELIYGLKPGVDRAAFQKAVESGQLEKVLHRQPVKAGECYFIPAGMIHGIGARVVVAEVQQNSDLTYRVYDYDRTDKDGHPRPLHLRQALDVVRPFTPEEIHGIRFAKGEAGLVNCPFFFTDLKNAPFTGHAAQFQALLAVGGEGEVISADGRAALRAGCCCVLPEDLGDYEVTGTLQFLQIAETRPAK